MRGSLIPYNGNSKGVRNTPAYAGITSTMPVIALRNWKHPRVCGDHCCAILTLKQGFRNTPAYAGITWLSKLHERMSEKHPRVCGDHSAKGITFAVSPETPPRMRGSRHKEEKCLNVHRNTPAYAGITVTTYPGGGGQ